MKKIILSLFLLGNAVCAQNVGINTRDPQAMFHVDGGKDNPAIGVPSAAQALNDFVITKEGGIGVGTLSPRATMEIIAKNTAPTSTEIEGIIIPKLSRDRLKAMQGMPEGTLVYVNDVVGSTTDTAPGRVRYVDVNGLYFWSPSGTDGYWSKFETFSQPSNSDTGEGVTVRKSKKMGALTEGQSVEVACGKFKFRIYHYKSSDNSTQPARIQWALRDGYTYSGTIKGAFRNTFETNNYYYSALTRTFNGTTADNSYLPLNNTAFNGNLGTAVDPTGNGQYQYFIGNQDVFDIYLTYPGDTDFYKVTFAVLGNGTTSADDYNAVSCNRY